MPFRLFSGHNEKIPQMIYLEIFQFQVHISVREFNMKKIVYLLQDICLAGKKNLMWFAVVMNYYCKMAWWRFQTDEIHTFQESFDNKFKKPVEKADDIHQHIANILYRFCNLFHFFIDSYQFTFELFTDFYSYLFSHLHSPSEPLFVV